MNLPAHFLMRSTRRGPLVPARLWLCDFEPGCPENILDRGRLTPYPRADVAGIEVPPEQVLDRLGIWRRRGDILLLPHEAVEALADDHKRTPRPVGHWAYAEPITAQRYAAEVRKLQWASAHKPDAPGLRPKSPVKPKQLELPNFDRENSL